MESGTNYEMSADLGYIRLRDMVMNEILGCSFTLEDRNTGQVVLEVGSPADSLGTNLSLMMLKPRNSHPNHPSWELMFKNVSLSDKLKFEKVTGNSNKAEAKIAGITPA